MGGRLIRTQVQDAGVCGSARPPVKKLLILTPSGLPFKRSGLPRRLARPTRITWQTRYDGAREETVVVYRGCDGGNA